MDLHLPEEMALRIQKHVDADHGETTLDVLQKALDQLENAENVTKRFECFRGMLKDMTVEEMLTDRREGLAQCPWLSILPQTLHWRWMTKRKNMPIRSPN